MTSRRSPKSSTKTSLNGPPGVAPPTTTTRGRPHSCAEFSAADNLLRNVQVCPTLMDGAVPSGESTYHIFGFRGSNCSNMGWSSMRSASCQSPAILEMSLCCTWSHAQSFPTLSQAAPIFLSRTSLGTTADQTKMTLHIESTEVVFSFTYLLVSLCFIAPPREFVSAGFTVQNMFSRYLGSEDLDFVGYHMRRTAATVFIHCSLPIGENLSIQAFLLQGLTVVLPARSSGRHLSFVRCHSRFYPPGDFTPWMKSARGFYRPGWNTSQLKSWLELGVLFDHDSRLNWPSPTNGSYWMDIDTNQI